MILALVASHIAALVIGAYAGRYWAFFQMGYWEGRDYARDEIGRRLVDEDEL